MAHQCAPLTIEESESQVPCRACGSAITVNLGRLRDIKGVIKLADPGSLYQCSVCDLLFRFPYLSAEELGRAYDELPDDAWSGDRHRLDHRLATKVIQRFYHSGHILDVGCYQGDFLQMLAGDYRKYGIEPSVSASKVAREGGVLIIGPSVERAEITTQRFSVITLFDVVEHLPYPLASLQKLADALLPGGMLILSTGNSDVIPWRLMRRDYWYYYPDHVSFFNPRWFRWAAKRLGMHVYSITKFSPFKGSLIEGWQQFAACMTYGIVENSSQHPRLNRLLCSLYPFNRVRGWVSPPTALYWKDHILVMLRKVEAE